MSAKGEPIEVCACGCPRYRHTFDEACRGCDLCASYTARNPRALPVDNCVCRHRRTRHGKRAPHACSTCDCAGYHDARQLVLPV